MMHFAFLLRHADGRRKVGVCRQRRTDDRSLDRFQAAAPIGWVIVRRLKPGKYRQKMRWLR